MASKQAYKRLMKEYALIQEQPPPFIQARPSEKNILEWHYVITGPPDSPYAGGEYHGKLTFPPDYPFKPPSIQIMTPNGRFKTQTRLCLSMSDFHPETWNPSWSVASILTGLLSFMLEETSTLGSMNVGVNERKQLAQNSYKWNRESNPKFKEIFPDLFNQPRPTPQATETNKKTETSTDRKKTVTDKKEDDLILNEMSLLVNSAFFKMFLGGIVIYGIYAIVSK